MKSILFLCLFLAACVSKTKNPADDQPPVQARTVQSAGYDIWELKKMAEAGQFAELNELFNNGISMETLPTGYAAGAGAKVLGASSGFVTKALDAITADAWRGKIFFPSTNPKISEGLNRIQKLSRDTTKNTEMLGAPVQAEKAIVPMASFVTKILDQNDSMVRRLVPDAKSNVVILNYAHPKTKPYFQETLLTKIQVYDIMVAIEGKYGPLYVGKTWLGQYDSKGEFQTKRPRYIMAWFFLDFNPSALEIQKAAHWDDSVEKILNPLPQVDKYLR